MPNRQVQYWCAPCGKRIRKKPSQHPCILSLAMREDQRQAIIDKLPVLKIPDGPKQRRARKQKRLAPLSSGDPGSMRLAPPPNHLPDTPPVPTQEMRTGKTQAPEGESIYECQTL
ncbi:hypothetical protein TNIN_438451 [Trichonephila inaurata madagascariensis]|uniref:Uncharacterized protein n=1 Tax=Trichonephila inaurata madagascariensis TaxID=2747483 RepID=A0A8X6WUY3_9ARAC|nr:hypothetical protein TNIN_438451 [Trichonephila inaurata madagascariensis]